MADKNVLRAVSFYNRALKSEDLQQRLLCLYDGFVCLYGPMDACRKAAAEASLDRRLLERVIDSCMDDGDADYFDPDNPEDNWERIFPTESMVSSLQQALFRLTADCR